jgi:hypothetical protein
MNRLMREIIETSFLFSEQVYYFVNSYIFPINIKGNFYVFVCEVQFLYYLCKIII